MILTLSKVESIKEAPLDKITFKYYLNEPYLEGNEKKYVNKVIDSGWLGAGGEFTKKFENCN